MPDTDLIYKQPPPMTAAHVEAMREVVRIWPFAAVVPTYQIVEVAQHLEALLAQPVPHTWTPLEVIPHAWLLNDPPAAAHLEADAQQQPGRLAE